MSILIAIVLLAQSVESRCDRLEEAVLEIIKQNPQAIFDALLKHQSKQARLAKEAMWRASKTNPTIIDTSHAPKKGVDGARLRLIEFGDFQCTHCARAQPLINNIMEKYKGKVQLAFLYAPGGSRPLSREAALAAWAASKQGKFFEFKDKLFTMTGRIKENDFTEIADELGLDLQAFQRDRASVDGVVQIDADLKRAKQADVLGTPTFFLNGVRVEGLASIEEFDRLIETLGVFHNSDALQP